MAHSIKTPAPSINAKEYIHVTMLLVEVMGFKLTYGLNCLHLCIINLFTAYLSHD